MSTLGLSPMTMPSTIIISGRPESGQGIVSSESKPRYAVCDCALSSTAQFHPSHVAPRTFSCKPLDLREHMQCRPAGWACTQRGGRVGSPGRAPLTSEQRPRRSPARRFWLSFLAAAAQLTYSLFMNFLCCLCTVNCVAKAGFGPRGRQVRALDSSLLQKP